MTNKKNIIFDLGRILVGLDSDACVKAFQQVGCGGVAHYVQEHKVADLFLDQEVGRITTQQFCDEARRLCQCQVPDTDIIWAWNQVLTGIPDEKKQALLALKRQGHRLFLLSNTNYIHWYQCRDHFFPYTDAEGHTYTATDYFERIFLSCAMHKAKPHPDIFRQTLDEAGIKAADTLFIDDREDNCQGAQALGISTLHDPTGCAWLKEIVK